MAAFALQQRKNEEIIAQIPHFEFSKNKSK